MKKEYIFLLLLSSIVFSCAKKENELTEKENVPTAINYEHRAIPIELNSEKNSIPGNSDGYLLVSTFGHSEKDCNGCVKIDGVYKHVDCVGAGNLCKSSAAIAVYSTSNGFNAITVEEGELTDSDIFLMPNRSLYVGVDKTEHKHIWLNIPEQLSIKDSKNGQFVFNDLYFSNSQEFENE
jgi:hypothetical protein